MIGFRELTIDPTADCLTAGLADLCTAHQLKAVFVASVSSDSPSLDQSKKPTCFDAGTLCLLSE